MAADKVPSSISTRMAEVSGRVAHQPQEGHMESSTNEQAGLGDDCIDRCWCARDEDRREQVIHGMRRYFWVLQVERARQCMHMHMHLCLAMHLRFRVRTLCRQLRWRTPATTASASTYEAHPVAPSAGAAAAKQRTCMCT
jgi:hypothetical protein